MSIISAVLDVVQRTAGNWMGRAKKGSYTQEGLLYVSVIGEGKEDQGDSRSRINLNLNKQPQQQGLIILQFSN